MKSSLEGGKTRDCKEEEREEKEDGELAISQVPGMVCVSAYMRAYASV